MTNRKAFQPSLQGMLDAWSRRPQPIFDVLIGAVTRARPLRRDGVSQSSRSVQLEVAPLGKLGMLVRGEAGAAEEGEEKRRSRVSTIRLRRKMH
jgi:hypothetical protein